MPSDTMTGDSTLEDLTIGQSAEPRSAEDTATKPERHLSVRRQRQLLPRPGVGQVRLNLGAVGLSPLGVQAVGTVDAVGRDAVGFAAGDRVALRVPGSRPAFPRIASERDLIGIPRDISFDDAAAILPAGLIARTIVKQLRPIGRGNRVRIASDGSGVDRFVAAWAKHLGAVLVGDVNGTDVNSGDVNGDDVNGSDGRGSDVNRGDQDVRSTDIHITPADFMAARKWKFSHGLAQLAATDVFQLIREGAFESVDVKIHPLGDATRVQNEIEQKRTAGPVVLMPGDVTLAA